MLLKIVFPARNRIDNETKNFNNVFMQALHSVLILSFQKK